MSVPEALDLLLQLLEDEEVAGHAVTAIAKMGAKVPREAIEPFLEHEAGWIRENAQKIVSRYEG